MATRAKATIDDVLRRGARGERYELIDGVLVPMSPTGQEHGAIEAHVTWVWYGYVIPRRLGKVFAGEVLFHLDREAGLRAPDVAFVRRERLLGPVPTGAFAGAPDIAVEIVPPGDSAKGVQRKVEDRLSHGTRAVLVMHPATRSVDLSRPDRSVTLHDDDVVDLGDVLEGFRCRVLDLFPPFGSDSGESGE
jgi:Uma2 family endonuclease